MTTDDAKAACRAALLTACRSTRPHGDTTPPIYVDVDDAAAYMAEREAKYDTAITDARAALAAAQDRPAEPPPVCGCCGRGEPEATLRKPLPGWTQGEGGLPEHFCTDCFRVWYDAGVTDPTEIKRRVLAAAQAKQ